MKEYVPYLCQIETRSNVIETQLKRVSEGLINVRYWPKVLIQYLKPNVRFRW